MNKHRVVEIKLGSLTTGDYLLLARLWLSPALLVVVETGASLAFRPLQVDVGAAVASKSPIMLQTLEGCYHRLGLHFR